jgi:VWFA-related protein
MSARIHVATRVTLLVAFVSALTPLPLVAQQPADSPSSTTSLPSGAESQVPQSKPSSGGGQNGGYKISVGVEAVLVPVVVRDSRGRAVGNLKKQDFEVFDQGKARTISGFTVETRASSASAGSAIAAAPDLGKGAGAVAAAPASPAGPPEAGQPRCTVLVFDDMHLNEGDLMRAKAVGTKLLNAPIGKLEAVAVVSMSGSNSGLLQNSAQLQEAVAKLHLTSLYRKSQPECPDVSYVEADRIMNKHDGTALEGAIANYFNCSNSVGMTREIAERAVEGAAAHVLDLGDQDARISLSFIAELVQRMKTLPGQRTLVLVSPGFLTITPESMSFRSQILDTAAQANVTISALDARGVYTTEINADERGARSQLELTTGVNQDYRRETEERAGNVLGELADGTGGTYVHNSNDLDGGLHQLMQGPEFLYVLEFSLDGIKHDGAYHTLSVKVDRPGVHLQARHGYFAPRPEKHKKQ